MQPLTSRSMMDAGVLVGLMRVICKVWVEDVELKGRTLRELLKNFVTVAECLQAEVTVHGWLPSSFISSSGKIHCVAR